MNGTLVDWYLHPPLTVFAPSAISLLVVLEVYRMVRGEPDVSIVVSFLLGVACVGTAAAFFSGYQASDFANRTFVVADDAIARHHLIGRILLLSIFPCAALWFLHRAAVHAKSIWLWCYRGALLGCFGLVLVTCYLGGQLVFAHGAGVHAVTTTSESGVPVGESPESR